MLSLQNYASSSDTESDNEQKNDLHLQPIDKGLSVMKSLEICAAPIVIPVVSFFLFNKQNLNTYLFYDFRVPKMFHVLLTQL